MILIVDSGASKSDWAIVKNGKVFKILQSKGISPIFHSSEYIFELVREVFLKENLVDQIDNIFFYGAGCIKGHNSDIVESGLSRYFKKSIIDTEGDMIGAARALFGKNNGIACILGTGANSCKYDGSSIIERIPTLGYILGDECSGAYLGKTLINNYFKKIMPSDISNSFKEEFNPVENDVLNKVYKQESPNRYLASFVPFLKKNLNHTYVIDLLENAFHTFISNNIAKYEYFQKYKIGFVGSVSFHFSEILKQVADKNGLNVVKILEKPIEGLIEYHF
jgi:glucosamine kinase